MMQYGELDEDTPVTIPNVPTNFIIQPMPPQSSHNDQACGIPPLPSGRYKKHGSDPARNTPQLSPIFSSSSNLSRSKSCGEGRSSEPSDAFDVLSKKASTERLGSGAPLIDKSTRDLNGCHEDNGDFEPPKPSTADYKCNLFCVSLPNLSSRKKPMQVCSKSHLSTNSAEGDNVSKDNMYRPDLEGNTAIAARQSVISKVASLERFDLSVSSDIVIDCFDERHGLSYFDLPVELISSGEDDPDMPVNSAFMFENDRKAGRHKKKSSSSRATSSKTSSETSKQRTSNSRTSSSSKVSNASSSMQSSRSSPCIRPKIMKELDTLVEAQST